MSVTTTLPASVVLNDIGEAFTESGNTVIGGNSGEVIFDYDNSVASVSYSFLGTQIVINPGTGFANRTYDLTTQLTITAVGGGSTSLVITANNTTVKTVEVTVTQAQQDDDEFLNKRGLTHFWENIDTNKISHGDVQTSDIANGAVTSAKINYSSMGPVWSRFYFSGTSLSDQTVNVTTKKGRALTLRIAAGGTAIRIISGASGINAIRQFWSAKLNSVANEYGVAGLKSASTVYTRFFGSRGNTAIGEGEVASTASSGTDGMCEANLGTVSNAARTSSTAEFLLLRESTDVEGWSIYGTIGSGGILATASFEAKTISAAGYAPTVYQRSATSSNTSYVFNCIEVLEP